MAMETPNLLQGPPLNVTQQSSAMNWFSFETRITRTGVCNASKQKAEKPLFAMFLR